MGQKLFTSESVTSGHPDKLADQISDAFLDAILKQDEHAKVAVEIFICKNLVVIGGEINTSAQINPEQIVRQKLLEIGFEADECGINGHTCRVQNELNVQSPDIANLVIREDGEIGAGDQGHVFGYATAETETFLPITLYYSHKLAKRLEEVRKSNELNYLLPDGKTQVTFIYDETGSPVGIDTIIISTQHRENVELEQLRLDIQKFVIAPIIPKKYLSEKTKIYINHCGKFVIGGPLGDTGLTGRKIIVDTYGGYCAHGGGAFSGKDASKVDRSAAYMARYIAKNIVAAKLAQKCQIQISYGIGIVEPISVGLELYGTEVVAADLILECINQELDLSPAGIIKQLDLTKPIYTKTATYGHFGQDNETFSWEKLDLVPKFAQLLS
ncbi:MAG: methionine adenosyltransferase [Mycoplasmatales bacterium]